MDQHDILIKNISVKYGTPKDTQPVLKQLLQDSLFIQQYGSIQSVRIPFEKNAANKSTYYGFMTMENIQCHEEMVNSINNKIQFGDKLLAFQMSGSRREPKKQWLDEDDFVLGNACAKRSADDSDDDDNKNKKNTRYFEQKRSKSLDEEKEQTNTCYVKIINQQQKLQEREQQLNKKENEIVEKEKQVEANLKFIKHKYQELEEERRKNTVERNKAIAALQIDLEIKKLKIEKEALEAKIGQLEILRDQWLQMKKEDQ